MGIAQAPRCRTVPWLVSIGLTIHPETNTNAAEPSEGSRGVITYAYKLDGDTLSLTQQRNQTGLFANPFTLKLVRVE